MSIKNWDKEYHHVGIKLEPSIARVLNDDALDAFLQNKMKNSRILAEHIKSIYFKEFQKELDISTKSLAIEILGHYRIQRIIIRFEKVFGKAKPIKWIDAHMCVIDCGEKAVDNNRFIWDGIAKLR